VHYDERTRAAVRLSPEHMLTTAHDGSTRQKTPATPASRKYLKAHADSSAGTGEVYCRESDPAPRGTSPRSYRVCTSSEKARADEQRAVALPQSVRRYLAKETGPVGDDTFKSANKN
jgi:hypothetical protein